MMAAQAGSRRTLVIGLGNPLLGDDAFGPRVIERLRLEAAGSLHDADLLDAYTDLLGQIDLFPAYEQVVLVDAILIPEGRESRIGQVQVLDEEAVQALPATSPSVHQFSPVLALKLFRSLHPHAATQIRLVGLCTSRVSIDSGTVASPGAIGAEVISAGAAKVFELL
jgi:hydrogenase maturation protease